MELPSIIDGILAYSNQKELAQEKDPTEEQRKWFISAEVIMIFFCSLGICFGFYNVYNFLYKQSKWKIYTNVGIYYGAISCLTLNIAYSILCPIKDYCNLSWFLTSYLSVYFNLGVGMCQAYLLSMLNYQLTCLFDF